MVEGEAGSGKTVLMSTLFYELKKVGYEDDLESLNVHLLVNHDEHVMIYRQIASKLGLSDKPKKVINKPTSFILDHKPKEKVDIVIVDEAHLLLTQGKMSYKGKKNTSLGNKEFTEKRLKLKDSNIKHNMEIAKNESWTRKEIEERAQKLANKITCVWPK